MQEIGEFKTSEIAKNTPKPRLADNLQKINNLQYANLCLAEAGR
jgi:hypothetical protein